LRKIQVFVTYAEECLVDSSFLIQTLQLRGRLNFFPIKSLLIKMNGWRYFHNPIQSRLFSIFKPNKVELKLNLEFASIQFASIQFASIQFAINTGKDLFKDITSFNKILIPTFLDLYGRKQRTILSPIDHKVKNKKIILHCLLLFPS